MARDFALAASCYGQHAAGQRVRSAPKDQAVPRVRKGGSIVAAFIEGEEMNPMRGKLKVLTVMAVFVVTTGVVSQENPKQQSGVVRLRFYIGDWAYSEVYEKSPLFPNGGRNTGTWTGQSGPRGLSVVNAFESHGTGEYYEGMEIMTWDPKENIYRDHAIWYDSPGQWEFTGHFEGDALIYQGEFDWGGKRVKFRSETRPMATGGFTLDEYASIDGEPEQKILRGIATPRQ